MDSIIHEIKNGNLDEALRLCNSLLGSDEFNLELLDIKAIIQRKQNDFNAALDTHNSLINLLPEQPDYYAERGLTFHTMKENDAALSDFNRAVELDPDNPYRYSSRAFVRDYYGDHAGALDDYNKAIALDPNDSISLNNKGVIEEKLGRLEDAKSSFNQSDKISGIDKQLNEVIAQANAPANQDNGSGQSKQSKLSLPSYFKTIKALFLSSEERKKFFRFLGMNK